MVNDDEKTPCQLDCFWDKELQACGTCLRTKEEIAKAGRDRKMLESLIQEAEDNE